MNWVERYSVAVVGTALMVAVRYALDGVLGTDAATLFLVAVMAVAWFGGVRPGLLATVLSVATEAWLFTQGEQAPGATEVVPWLALLALLGGLASWLGGTMHRHDQRVGEAEHLAERIGAARDRAEVAMRISETRYRRLFESAKDGILILDDSTATVTDANPYIAQLLECTRADLLGRELWEFGVFKDKDASKAAMEELQATGYIRYEDLPLETRAGRQIDVEFVSNVYVENGHTVIQCNIRDITERHRARESERGSADVMRQYAAELSESDRRKNEFLAILAHELRNPLAPISNALHIMRRAPGDAALVRRSSEMMQRQIEQLVRLVDDLLDVSRISRGRIELRRERVELVAALQHAVDATSELARCMSHEITVVVPPEPIYVHADPTRLAQVIGNLINNACKYTDVGGRITLSVECDGDHVVIRVGDNGIGIADDYIPRLFDMFMQVDLSLHRASGGLGIGLTLVKTLVEMHGGTVAANSAGVGMGSEFVVRLPIMVEASVVARDDHANPLATSAARRILVIDDNVDAASSLAHLLNLTGHEARSVFDGERAVEEAADFRPEVVLLDIGLPRLNGYEVCRRIREQPWGADIFVIALSGWGQDEDRERSRDAGFNDHMLKPVDYSALARLLGDRATEEFVS